MSPKTRRWLLIIGVIVGILTALAGSAFYLTGQPGFCNTCHVMNYFYDTWQKSSHPSEEADCLNCHADPGIIGEIKAHISGMRYLYAQFFKDIDPKYIRTTVPSNRCLQCHPLGQLPENGSQRPPLHTFHMTRADTDCSDCHDNLVHGTPEGEPVKPAEEFCQDCHSSAFLEELRR